jgi:type IV pilus assembly protein PilQ
LVLRAGRASFGYIASQGLLMKARPLRSGVKTVTRPIASGPAPACSRIDADQDGIIELPDEAVPVGTNVVALGGNSVAALGNATSRVAGPTLTLLSSLLIGRHTLISFIEALESTNFSEVQAEPYITVMDNELARIVVGEETPIRVIDASAGGAGGGQAGGGGGQQGGLPVASVQIQETGIILEATPTIVGDMVMMALVAERSAPQLAATDAGVFFTKQNATTRVLVRDGETIVIGGLTVTDESEVRAGIPLLMDLPLIGRLFRVTRKSSAQRDLIILVTPHIVRD